MAGSGEDEGGSAASIVKATPATSVAVQDTGPETVGGEVRDCARHMTLI